MPPETDADRASSDRERATTATAALAQLVATTEEFQRRAIAAEALAHAAQGQAQLANERVAHGLHDTVAQSLVSAHRFLEAARASQAVGRHDVASEQLDNAQAAVLEAIAELRTVIESLAAPGDAQ